jgi:hypothetical protein
VTGALLAIAACLAFALTGVDRTRRQRKWRRAAWAFLALGVDVTFGIHAWLQSEGVSWYLAYLPLLVPASIALADALRVLRSHLVSLALFGGGLVLLVASALVDSPTLSGSETGAEILAMASAILFVLALVGRHRYLARQYYPLEEAETRLSVDQIAAEALSRIPFRKVAIVLGLLTAAEAIQYMLFHVPGYPHCPAVLDPCHARDAATIGILDLNNEQTLATTYQTVVLMAAGGLALVTGHLRTTRAEMKIWWLTLGAVLVALGAEQTIDAHNRFADSTDLPGQIILLPIAVAGVMAWLKVLQAIWGNRLARNLFVAGAALWVMSQMSDLLLDSSFTWTTTPEETAETTASILWMFSLLVWMRSVLPVGLMPPEPTASKRMPDAIITPLPNAAERAQATTG